MPSRARRIPWGLAVLVALFLVPALGSRFYTFLANDVVIWALFATSLNLLVGYTGLVSFGHAAYFGIGAYATGLLMKKLAVPFLVAFPAAGVVAGLQEVVAVQEHHELAPGHLDADVPGHRGATVPLLEVIPDPARVGMAPDHLRGVVGGAVVDHDHLERQHVLGEGGVEGLGDEAGPVEGRHHDAEGGHVETGVRPT